MIIEVNPNNSTDLYSLASQKQQVLQSHVLTIPSTGWTEDLTTHIWSYTANFSPDFGAEIGLFDNPNLIASYTIPQGDMSNYNKCASCNVRVASIVLPTPGASNYGAKVVADLQPDINISLDFIIYGKNDSVGDKASDSVSQYIIEHCIAQYQPSFAYAVGNMCYQDGVIYKCIANTTGHIPPNNTYWVRFDKDLQDRVLTLEQNYATLSISDTITKTNLGSFTIDGTKLIKFANGAPSQSTSTIGNSSTPVYVNSGVLTACSNVVSTDTAQTITGLKTINRDDTALEISNPTFTKYPSSGEKVSQIRFYDKDKANSMMALMSYRRANGDDITVLRHYTANGSTRDLRIYDTYMGGTTPSADAPSNALVTKAEVYGTNNLSNNLVHTISNEEIGGVKTFTDMPRAIVRSKLNQCVSNTAGWYKVFGLTVGNRAIVRMNVTEAHQSYNGGGAGEIEFGLHAVPHCDWLSAKFHITDWAKGNVACCYNSQTSRWEIWYKTTGYFAYLDIISIFLGNIENTIAMENIYNGVANASIPTNIYTTIKYGE